MTKATPTTKDQLVYYMLANISLGTYDKRFLTNIQSVNLVKHKPVTTNQSDLLDKITFRYSRQLAKKELDVTELIGLNWSIKPIPSSPVFTEAHITIKDNNIIVQSPYKNAFVREYTEHRYPTWDKINRSWVCPLSEETLRDTVNTTTRHYEKINYSDEVQQVLNTMRLYHDIKYWNPTLVEVNNMLYIAASNSSLHEAIKHIELKTDLATIARLVHYGITISEDIKYTLIQRGVSTEHLEFASNRSLRLEYDASLLLRLLVSVQPDFVLMNEWFGVNKEFTDTLKKGLAEANIKYQILDRRSDIGLSLRDFSLPIILSSWSVVSASGLAAMSAKTINLVNSNPIKIK